MAAPDPPDTAPLVHRALIHDDEDELLAHLTRFAREGVEAGEETVVLAPLRRLAAVRAAVGVDAPVHWMPGDLHGVRMGTAFDDIRRHLDARAGRGRLRFAADWDLTGRAPSERRAFMRWESATTALLSRALLTALCCHDGADPQVAADARATHPEVWSHGGWSADPSYQAPAAYLRGSAAPPPLPGDPMPLLDPWDLAPLRERIAAMGAEAGIDIGVVADFEIAANEVAANALWHARGTRDVRVAILDGALVCEVRDGGPGLDPLTAYAPPAAGNSGGRGLWIAHQLADTVQVIADGGGTRVRLEVATGAAVTDGADARRLRGEGDLGGGP